MAEGGQMAVLKADGLKWLKGVHPVAVACWVGGAVSLLLLYFLKGNVSDGGVLYGINQSIHHVDNGAYLYNQQMNLVFGALQCALLIVTIFISILKPWKKRVKKRGY